MHYAGKFRKIKHDFILATSTGCTIIEMILLKRTPVLCECIGERNIHVIALNFSDTSFIFCLEGVWRFAHVPGELEVR